MVDFESRLNSLRVNLLKRLDLPTPESPIRTTVRKCVSVDVAGMIRGMRSIEGHAHP